MVLLDCLLVAGVDLQLAVEKYGSETGDLGPDLSVCGHSLHLRSDSERYGRMGLSDGLPVGADSDFVAPARSACNPNTECARGHLAGRGGEQDDAETSEPAVNPTTIFA